MKINKILLTLVILILFLIFPIKIYAESRTTTYIGNYEVTVADGVRKEVVRVAGIMGKVVKSRESGKLWEYTYYTTDVQGSTRQELTESVIVNTPVIALESTAGDQASSSLGLVVASGTTQSLSKPNTYYAYGTPIPVIPDPATPVIASGAPVPLAGKQSLPEFPI